MRQEVRILFGAYRVPSINQSVRVCITFMGSNEVRPKDRIDRGRLFNEAVFLPFREKASSYQGA